MTTQRYQLKVHLAEPGGSHPLYPWSLCGRMRGFGGRLILTAKRSEVTCLKCLDILRRMDTYGDSGDGADV